MLSLRLYCVRRCFVELRVKCSKVFFKNIIKEHKDPQNLKSEIIFVKINKPVLIRTGWSENLSKINKRGGTFIRDL